MTDRCSPISSSAIAGASFPAETVQKQGEEMGRLTAPWPDRRKGPALRTGPARAGFALAPAGPGHGLGEG